MVNELIKKGMHIAIEEAQKAFQNHEVPVGACVFYHGECISRAHNTMHATQNPLFHAEYMALQSSLTFLSPHTLRESILFITLEPCCMCAGAIELLGISRVYFGAYDTKMGQIDHNHRVLRHTKTQILGGFYERECAHLLTQFFQNKR